MLKHWGLPCGQVCGGKVCEMIWLVICLLSSEGNLSGFLNGDDFTFIASGEDLHCIKELIGTLFEISATSCTFTGAKRAKATWKLR